MTLSRRHARRLVQTDALLGAEVVPMRPAGGRRRRPTPEKVAALAEVQAQHALHCPLCVGRSDIHTIVFGEGDPDARLMFVGEAPGEQEDLTGRPFVGRAGQLLDKMIEAMGLKRQEVYIANILKARPPNNATPTPMEVEQCSPWLAAQIEVINPEVIVALGAPSAKFLLATTQGISALRGTWHRAQVGAWEGEIMPTYHPAYLLRNYTKETRGKVWADLQMVVTRLGIG